MAVTWRAHTASRLNGAPLCLDIWTSLLSLHPDHLPPDSQSGGGVQKPVVAQRLFVTPMANPMAGNDFPWLLLLRWSGVCLHRQPARSTRPLLPDGCSCEVSQVVCPDIWTCLHAVHHHGMFMPRNPSNHNVFLLSLSESLGIPTPFRSCGERGRSPSPTPPPRTGKHTGTGPAGMPLERPQSDSDGLSPPVRYQLPETGGQPLYGASTLFLRPLPHMASSYLPFTDEL